MDTQAADDVPVPEHGPSKAVNWGQVSLVPLNPEQFDGSLQPDVPFQTQVLFHVWQAVSEVATVLVLQDLGVQAAVAIAVLELVHMPSVPVKF